ncbi:MAG TPA: TIGR03564 family F420-dependent LLM class oxidoreductase [Acidimicrobiales bacterium]|jgi:F420-dependent oxidoreductase-like protein|nr:TIGR03564 family F420-dependent LLM class oxidoreductase [Acidimicrobiales bacterium]
MRIGIFGGDAGQGEGGIDELVKSVHEIADQGFASYWLPQIFGVDALTAFAVVGHQVPGIELGTAVIPTYPRHPMMLASQALTVQSAIGGRLALGIGLSHEFVIEQMWGYSFAKPVRHMREYLSILRPLLHERSVQFKGEALSAAAGLTVAPEIPAPPILVAALGTQMLRLTGRMADGTITWVTGPSTLAEHTVPTLRSATAEAGRPEAFRVVACLPVCVTADEAGARDRAAKVFAIYGQLPSYRAMLDREGAAGPADVALVGDEAAVRAEIERVAETGATDFLAAEFGATEAERTRTRELLRSLV